MLALALSLVLADCSGGRCFAPTATVAAAPVASCSSCGPTVSAPPVRRLFGRFFRRR